MADSTLFDQVSELLEGCTELDKLESRGTVRLALRAAGLEVRTLDKAQMQVVLERLLPGELTSRGIGNAQAACDEIATRLAGMDSAATTGTSPEEIFRRLAG